MVQKLEMMGKKLLKMVKVVFFMLRKGISKSKLLSDLNNIIKRRNIIRASAPLNEIPVLPRFDNDGVASPVLPGFGASPMVRKLRVTDSPFPVMDLEEDDRVNEAAEEFIIKFYKDLRLQNSASYFG